MITVELSPHRLATVDVMLRPTATVVCGVAGAPGPPGPEGPPGPPGGSVSGHATYDYNTTLTEPPADGQIRMNSTTQTAVTKLWIDKDDHDGLDVTLGLKRIQVGWQIYIQKFDDATRWVTYTVTTAPLDKGLYFEFGVAFFDGSATMLAEGLSIPPGLAELQSIAPGTVGLPHGGTVTQVLTKDSASDFDVSWKDPVRLVVKATAPVAADYGLTTIPVGAVWVQSP